MHNPPESIHSVACPSGALATSTSIVMDLTNPDSVLDLSNIRAVLIRLEDTILFDLIERAQYFRSREMYKRGAFPGLGPNFSFLEYTLRETEVLHSKLRRYQAPDENPFFPDAVQESLLPALHYPQVLAANHRDVNINSRILEYYINKIVPRIVAGDAEQPENYGSCAISDIQALQALSRRIHFGKYVAEAKFRSDIEGMSDMIRRRDVQGLLDSITKPEVEQKILERVRTKADAFAMDPHTMLYYSSHYSSHGRVGKLDPSLIVDVYANCIIPMTKDVEIDYLLHRLDPGAITSV